MKYKFNGKADKVIKHAEEEARKLGSEYVGSEHLLYGLSCEGSCSSGSLLLRNRVTPEAVESYIIQNVGEKDPIPEDRKICFSPRANSIFESAEKEAKKIGSQAIGTTHILIGILLENDATATRILMEIGVDRRSFLSELANMVSFEANNLAPKREEDDFGGDVDRREGALGKSGVMVLKQYGKNMTAAARDNNYDPVIGREKEITRIMEILSRRTKNNPCLIGEPGVGKTAVIEGLAQMIATGNVPEIMRNKVVLSLDLSGLIAGAKYRGEFEERIKLAIEEVKKRKDVILFIDEIHTIVGAGAAEGSLDAANILKPSLSRGEIQVIGATTQDEYRKYIEKDPALERRFQPIVINEPDAAASYSILKGLKAKYEQHHNVEITDEALHAAVNLSVRYINDRFLPDKAIDLVDEASSKKRLVSFFTPPEIKEIQEHIEELSVQKKTFLETQDFERCAEVRDEIKKEQEKLSALQEKWNISKNNSAGTVTENDIAVVVSDWTGIPATKIGENEMQRLMNLESVLHERVIGQNEAVTAVSKAVRRGRTGLKDPKRPIGSFIFLGPTGVGKTELSKALAEALFGDEKALITIDMSEYMEKHSVSRLVGSPPGYVGFDEGGQLTEKVRRKPYSVVLFDEIEKAHSDVFNILLQILEDGRLTDSSGRVVDFKNTVIIMTSNIGAQNITEPKQIGFSGVESAQEAHERMKQGIMEELKKYFKPEFINRVDDTIVFKILSKEEVSNITRLVLDNLIKRTESNGMTVKYDDSVVNFLTEKGYNPIYGARPIKREVQSRVEDTLSEEILSGRISKGDVVLITMGEDGNIKYVKE